MRVPGVRQGLRLSGTLRRLPPQIRPRDLQQRVHRDGGPPGQQTGQLLQPVRPVRTGLPRGFRHPGPLPATSRRSMVRRGKMPPSAHEFALQDMRFSTGRAFPPGTRTHPAGRKASGPFSRAASCAPRSPGRSSGSTGTWWTLPEGTGLMLGCCGAPAFWAGREDELSQGLRRTSRRLGAAGSSRADPRLLHLLSHLSPSSFPRSRSPPSGRSDGRKGLPARHPVYLRGLSWPFTTRAPHGLTPTSRRRSAGSSPAWGYRGAGTPSRPGQDRVLRVRGAHAKRQPRSRPGGRRPAGPHQRTGLPHLLRHVPGSSGGRRQTGAAPARHHLSGRRSSRTRRPGGGRDGPSGRRTGQRLRRSLAAELWDERASPCMNTTRFG
jgi:hypothetical protein